jgi:hypothetical protein
LLVAVSTGPFLLWCIGLCVARTTRAGADPVERLVGGRQRVEVPLGGGDADVPEPVLDDLQVRAARREPAGRCLAQVVKAHGTFEADREHSGPPHLPGEPVAREVPSGCTNRSCRDSSLP